MKRFFMGFLTLLLLEIIIIVGGYFAYTNGLFDSENIFGNFIIDGNGGKDIEKEQVGVYMTGLDMKALLGKNGAKNLSGSLGDEFSITTKDGKVNIQNTASIDLDKEVLLKEYIYSKIGEDELKFFIAGETLGLSFDEIRTAYNYAEFDTKTLPILLQNFNFDDYMRAYIKGYQTITQITKKYKKSIENLNKIMTKYNNKAINLCFNNFCSYNTQQYLYLKEAILKDDVFKETMRIAEANGLNSKLFMSIIMIENMRMYATYKGTFKRFLGFAVPKMSVMTKFSYGIYGTKVNMITRMLNNNYRGSKFYIGQNKTLEHIRNNFYKYNAEKKYWYPIEEKKVVDYIVASKYNQTNILIAFMKMQIAAWKKIGVDLSQPQNVGYLLTLYNIGKFKQPHKNPDNGGADITYLGNKKYNFGILGRMMYNSFEFDSIRKKILNKE